MPMLSSTLSHSLPLLLFPLLLNIQLSSPLSLSVEKLQHDVILSSPKPTFTAGFYPVGQNAYAFAIWFTQPHETPNATVVWMANRDHPVNGKRSTLSLLKTGNLVLTDAGQYDVWSTNSASSQPLELHLHDTGNLVLRETGSSSVLWQSFDFPTDTLLPDQSLSKNTFLVSSRSHSNYSSGFYKLFFDFENVLRLLYQGPRVSSVYWPDPWLQNNDFGPGGGTGRFTYNDSRVVIMDGFGKVVSSDKFSFRTSDYGTLLQRRLTLDHDGNARFYSRKDGREEWSISGLFRPQPCFAHGICGPNSVCSFDSRVGAKCTCLPGYSWNNSQDWSQGCTPNFKPWCESNRTLYGDGEFSFLRLPEVDFYGYDYGFFRNRTFEQCKALCLELCQCKGFQHSFSEENGVFQCYPKTQLLNGRRMPGQMGAIFLRLPKGSDYDSLNQSGLACSGNDGGVRQLERSYVKGKENGSVKFVLWFASCLGGVEIVCIFLVWCFLLRNSRQLVPLDADNQGYVLAAATGFRKFSYSELKRATTGFSQEIGRGAGGIVYKAVLPDDQVVAIKRLHEVVNQGGSEFLAEVSIIGRLNHMNLIGMRGYCAEGKHRLLVYEYMENGTLADNLSSNSSSLDWGKRYNIALGTAMGLAYLHEECLEWILHCDIKPQNILLDSDYRPKVADFGLSKLLNRNNLNNSGFSRIRGTRGYMAPEWVFNSAITSKVDVYSYGIVVLEMITGKSPASGIQITEIEAESYHHESLVTWVREKRRKGSEMASSWVNQIADPALGSNYDMNEMEILAMVALECVEEEKDERPSMSQVAKMLQSHVHGF